MTTTMSIVFPLINILISSFALWYALSTRRKIKAIYEHRIKELLETISQYEDEANGKVVYDEVKSSD